MGRLRGSISRRARTCHGRALESPALLIGVISSHHNPDSDRDHRTMIDIVNACDAVADLLDNDPCPTSESLAALAACCARRTRVHHVGPAQDRHRGRLAGRDHARQGHGYLPGRQRVLAPHSMLSEPTKQASYKLQVLRSTGQRGLRVLYFARDGVGFTGASKLRENSMVRLRVDSPKGPIEVLGVIVHCATEGTAHRMEAKLFAAEQHVLRTWLGFLRLLGLAWTVASTAQPA
jgi:hypothetical protein